MKLVRWVMIKMGLLFCIAFFVAQFAIGQTYLYVSLKGDNKVSAYSVNTDNGDLTYIYSQSVSGQPASIAIHPSKKFIYVAQRSGHKISSFSIDSLTGRLTFMNEIAAVDDPVYISTDNSGKFLLTTYYNASKAAVYSILGNGQLVATSVKEITTGINPHAILTDPSNQYMYISNMTGNRMEQYSFDANTGLYNQLNPFAVVPVENDCPRHFVFNNGGTIMYVVNEVSNSLTTYQLNIANGQLTEIQKVKTIPDNFTIYTKCADIHITPDNQFIYVSNRGHESIAAFRIDPNDGKLAAIDQYPTVGTPREFEIEPDGNFMYVAGESSNDLMWYRIKADGTLDSLKTIAVGKTPSWVTTVKYQKQVSVSDNSVFNDASDFELVVYPNPFHDHFSVSSTSDEKSKFSMIFYDVNGQQVSILPNNDIELYRDPLSYTINGNLPSGIYYCELNGDNVKKVVKLIRR